MTLNISGRCLCGSVSFECSAEPMFQGCCHCDDCRRSGGSLYASFVFVPAETLLVTGQTSSYQHQSDRGTTMTKEFCPTCGSQMFSSGSHSPDRRGIRVGVIDDASWFKPDAYVYASKKLPHTPIDSEITAYEKMRTA